MKKNERIDLLLEVLADQRRIGTLHHAAAERAEKRALSAETELATVKARAAIVAANCDTLRADVLAMEEQRDAAVRHGDNDREELAHSVSRETFDRVTAERDAALSELEHVKGIVLAPGVDRETLRRAVELALEYATYGELNSHLSASEVADAVCDPHASRRWSDLAVDAILAHIAAPAKAPAPPALFKVGDRVRAMGGRIIGTVASYQFGFFTIRDGDGTAWYCPAATMTLLSPQMDNQ